MTKPTYAEFVAALAKSGSAILETLTSEKIDLLHHAIGISGEAGELIDAVKKAAVYNKPLDRANVVEELGDLKFYTQGIMNNLGITEKEVEEANRAKLAERYKGLVYSDAAAQARDDKTDAA
jgi:NTP pyrophosphatase (non-canonical NTP hydrolase)